jgi:hypothetical protein
MLRDMVTAVLQQGGMALVGESGALGASGDFWQQPADVILVEDDGDAITEVLTQFPQLPMPRLVTISLVDNRLHIFQHEERLMHEAADLIQALQG